MWSMRDADKYSWGSSLHVPRVRPGVHPAVIGWGVAMVLFWTVVWYIA